MPPLRLGSTTVNCPDAGALADFYATITGGCVTYRHRSFATVLCPGGRIDFQTVDDYEPPTWPESAAALLHLDFLVEDLDVATGHVEAAGARRLPFQPNAAHCVVFTDPAGHPFCLTLLDELG